MTILSRYLILSLGIAVSLFATGPTAWADDAPQEALIATLAPSGITNCESGDETSSLVQLTSSALPVAVQPDRRNFKITAIDPARGLVTAQSVGTGEFITFKVPPAALQSLRAGQMVDVNYISRTGDRGRCACGQKSDGTCWCTTDEACCGPMHGCPIASCDKKGTGQGSGEKPVFQTPQGGGQP